MDINAHSRTGRVVDLGPDVENEPIVFADLHIHSRFSRATSPQMEVQTLYYWGRRKGIGLLGTGDFTHPEYFKELQEKLEPDPSGFYRVKGQGQDVLFVPSAEISSIYKQGGKVRRVHTMLVARNLESVQEINRALASRGNIAADGRPILGVSVRHLAKLVREIDPETLVIPAHIWTPWFSVLGERSGFESLAECFEEELDGVAAVETGLSSDPEMNWRLSQLDRFSIISNSDAHSPARIGRECNAFRAPLTWSSLREILLKKDSSRFRFTVEFFPEEGKYHWPGHAACGPAVSPGAWRELQGRCPVCGKSLTGGVASRVEALADRPEGFVPENAVPSVHLVPLDEIIAEALGKGNATQGVKRLWDQVVEAGGSELRILLFTPPEQLQAWAGERVAEAILRVRRGEVLPQPGYDGIYGKIRLFEEKKAKGKKSGSQLPLV
jgi:uncharacterized protein (TIGR00375 family)